MHQTVVLISSVMSFFNLTELGADNPVKSSVEKELHSGLSKDTGSRGTENKTPLVSSTQNASATTTFYPNSQANGSHVKYTTMLQKHQRSPNGPNNIYNKPCTTNMKYGWWMKDGVQSEPWTQTDRLSYVHSEMTRFVDEMSLTNREFTLF